jgi:hypothetical protein
VSCCLFACFDNLLVFFVNACGQGNGRVG